ncbi:MAG: thrombospondin type 3 repeat-containing protein [Chloroflexi bacterium]|nr:thrombospondin type 3 repeat-containing protein [Chloroflexota bacterium]
MKNLKVLSASIMCIVLIVTATGASARWNANPDPNGIAQQGPTATPQDTDGDGLPDTRDRCPNVAGPLENQGCPTNIIVTRPPTNTDTDGDGIPDSDDLCPTVAGVRENRGCPVSNPPNNPDTDGDGTVDTDDVCPTVAGALENRGCPVDNSPNSVPLSGPPIFTPPTLPTDGCFVTPASENNVNVRKSADLGGEVIGKLLIGGVYPAEGYVVVGTEMWFVLKTYEGAVGEIGYSSRSVLLASSCPQLPSERGDQTSGLDDYRDVPGDTVTLCHMSVGYDAPTWGAYNGPESYTYAAFWFESAPGDPIAAGTKIWGVIYLSGAIVLLPDSENAVAVAPDVALMELAASSGNPNAFYWPTMAGGVRSGDLTLYRLTDDNNDGACGPIVGLDDLAAPENNDPGVLEPMQCTVKPGTTLVDVCWCDTADSDCADQLVVICYGGDAYIESGPDTTACWFEELVDPELDLYFDEAVSRIETCGDDFTIWWIELPDLNGNPFALQDLGEGHCAEDWARAGGINPAFGDGSVRFISYRASNRPKGQNNLHQIGLAMHDCDQNAEDDRFQMPFPSCVINEFSTGDANQTRSSEDKETAAWWGQVLPLACPNGWLMLTEIDADGEEIVTDIACE